MGKKCLPGVFCIENMTLFVLIMITILLCYMYYQQYRKERKEEKENTKIVIVNPQQIQPLVGVSTRNDVLNDPYAPPMKTDGYFFRPDSGDIRGIPVNIRSRGLDMNYQQVGILTRTNSSAELILPLMGRRIMNGRDKWQYYTMSNTGNLNTKLPVSVKGKSCTGEYGCDNISNGDIVYVEGYKDTFNATIYENNVFNYIPF
jgi:cbb3-type cytochrome oxidase subunit 3